MVSDDYFSYVSARRAARRNEDGDIPVELWDYSEPQLRQSIMVNLHRLAEEADYRARQYSNWGAW